MKEGKGGKKSYHCYKFFSRFILNPFLGAFVSFLKLIIWYFLVLVMP